MRDVDDTLSDAADVFELQLRNEIVERARWLMEFHDWTPEQVKGLVDEALVQDVQEE